jgi:hypothetical protein
MNEENYMDDLLMGGEQQEITDPITGETYTIGDDVDNYQRESGNVREISEDDYNNDSYVGSGNSDDEAYINTILRQKGFDPDSIKVEDYDTGEYKEVRFQDLSDDEKYDILNSDDDDVEDLSDDEWDTIDFLRNNGMSLREFAEYVQNQAIEQYRQMQDRPDYKINDYSDDEVYMIDYRDRYGEDLTDEEFEAALELAKQNETLFNKTVARTRERYAAIEQQQMEQAKQQELQAEEQKRNAFISQVVNVARNTSEMHNTVDMDDNDKEGILRFMFDKTATGDTMFEKALLDPKTRYKAAWYIKHGDDVFDEIHRYYKGEIAKLSRANRKPEAVIKNTNKRNSTQKRPMTLDDLYN